MIGVWLWGVALCVFFGGLAVRLAWAEHRRRLTSRRRVEMPNSHYSSMGVRQQEDREKWGRIALERLHPLNREEVQRLLRRADVDGVHTLSSKDRLFLDNMTLPRAG